MSYPAAELQSAIFTALSNSTELSDLIGPDHVFDDVPAGVKPPYVVFGKSIHLDWSTDTESGMEHEIELHTWLYGSGRKKLYEIQQVLINLLSTIDGNLGLHHLVNLTHEQTEIEAHDKYRSFQGISLFRAITEPIT